MIGSSMEMQELPIVAISTLKPSRSQRGQPPRQPLNAT